MPPAPQPPRRGGRKGLLIGLIVVLGSLMIGGLATGGWLLLRASSDEPRPAATTSATRRKAVASATPTVAAVKLRALTGDQLCAAIPDAYRKTLVTDGKYGGNDASTSVATETEKHAACSWNNSKMDVGSGVLGYRSLKISVEARSSRSQNALDYAKDQFDRDKKSYERRVNVRDGKRIDGKTTGSTFGPLKELTFGDASYSQSSIGRSGLFATVYVRQGPWLIEISYGGDNRTGDKYPTGDSVREATGKVAELITAEMAKDAAAVKLSGPCAILTTSDIKSAFFPTVEGPSVGGNSGSIQQTSCTWKISEVVKHSPGQEFTARGGTLVIHLTNWGKDGFGSKFQFDRAAKKFDRYNAKGGVGDANIHTDYEVRQNISGLGEKAFAVVSSTYRPNRPEEGTTHEVLVEVLLGDRTLEFTYRGTTTGGGIVGSPGYLAPAFESSVAQSAVVRLAKTFVSDLK
ncbi:hypothetical protein [Nonomuraea sp. B19D2]|uniref:hypothetical protein n=1 Tax=Nonomuraea sp. B19D2 TaxID=3159561 RepID=UPI0032DBD180